MKFASREDITKDYDIARVADIIPVHNRMRFAVEYLGINPNQYKNVEADNQFRHHEIVFKCLELWRNMTMGSRDELIKILSRIQIDHQWFKTEDMAFLQSKELTSGKGEYKGFIVIGTFLFNTF